MNKQPICKASSDGTKYWYQNDKVHRVDGPAIEYTDGTKQWCLNGKYHRVDGPAYENPNGNNSWYLNDKFCKPIEVFKAATHEQRIHLLCFYASEFMP